jgi:hypothetical protein
MPHPNTTPVHCIQIESILNTIQNGTHSMLATVQNIELVRDIYTSFPGLFKYLLTTTSAACKVRAIKVRVGPIESP